MTNEPDAPCGEIVDGTFYWPSKPPEGKLAVFSMTGCKVSTEELDVD